MADDVDAAEPPVTAANAAPPGSAGARAALLAAAATLVTLAGLAVWMGVGVWETQRAQQRESMVVQAARQGAVNLTTLDYLTVEADVQRILDSATGQFYTDFELRSQPFIEVVKQAQSRSQGTVTAAGLEEFDGDRGRVLVTVSVATANAAAVDQPPRLWRMRVDVDWDGAAAKVSNVEFVP